MTDKIDIYGLFSITVYIFLIFVMYYLLDDKNYIYHDQYVNNERFVGKYDDTETDVLDIKLNDDVGPMKYLTTDEFNQMIGIIRKIVYKDIIKYSETCIDMNGNDGPQPNQITLQCNTDPLGMQQDIVNHITEYIINHIKKNKKVNLNPYQVTGDFIYHLNLLEELLYPLIYSGLYTVNGIQYFDKVMIIEKINSLKIRDVLFTTLLRRGIDVFQDDDQL